LTGGFDSSSWGALAVARHRSTSVVMASQATLAASSSAPTLRDSPYAAPVTGTSKLTSSSQRKTPTKWAPPPGAFNNPELPSFATPGPGRYTPAPNSVKPRVTGTRFGSEDRFKYLGPQQPLEATSSGMAGMYNPQASASPGPGYLPSYGLVHSSSRKSAFTVERRDTSGIQPGSGAATAPGPGLYNPNEKFASNRKNMTSGGAFLADDRHKYLGNVDPDSGGLRQNFSPGPLYKPSDHLTKERAGTVAFGGRGPGTIKKPPQLKQEAPGPGSYNLGTHLADGAVLSSKRRSPAASFGSTQRGDSAFIDSVHCFHGKVPVDMTNATNTNISPGPGYKPSVDSVKYMPPNATFGTAKRTTPNMALVK